MRHLRRFAFVAVSLLFGSVVVLGCAEKRWHRLSFQNFTDQVLEIEASGIQLYEPGFGPQSFRGTTHPNTPGGYSVHGPIRLTFPVIVRWRTSDGIKSGEKAFQAIPGVTGSTIDSGGDLAIGILANFDVRILFLKGDGVVSRKVVEKALRAQ